MHEQPATLADDGITALTVDALRRWPLPLPGDDGDKEERGRVLVIGGSAEMPGAVVLAAHAALRAGAGKVTIVTAEAVAAAVGVAVPEARVVGLKQGAGGGLLLRHPGELKALLLKADAVLVGPGMQDEASACELARMLVLECNGPKLLLDALAMGVVAPTPPVTLPRRDAPVLLTPHAGEMAHLCGDDKQVMRDASERAACAAAARWGAIVALKGATTVIASPDGRTWRYAGGNAGLATSGSGDALAGLIAGLAARGASLEQAAAWGVVVHAQAGERLRERHGPVGLLARELADQVPALLHAISSGT